MKGGRHNIALVTVRFLMRPHFHDCAALHRFLDFPHQLQMNSWSIFPSCLYLSLTYTLSVFLSVNLSVSISPPQWTEALYLPQRQHHISPLKHQGQCLLSGVEWNLPTIEVDDSMCVCWCVLLLRVPPPPSKQTKIPICHLMHSCSPGGFSWDVCTCSNVRLCFLIVWNWGAGNTGRG